MMADQGVRGVRMREEGPPLSFLARSSRSRRGVSTTVGKNQNLNGGGDATVFFLNRFGFNFGVKADLQGYASASQCPSAASELTGCVGSNQFTYMFGPVAKYRFGRFEPFGEVLFGGAHSNFYVSACNSNTVSPWPSAAAWICRRHGTSPFGCSTRTSCGPRMGTISF